jgi:phosphatase NudJ
MLAVKDCKTGKWDIPSGKPEGNETADQTAVRETLEETGLVVKVIRLLEHFEHKFYVFECELDKCVSRHNLDNLTVPILAKDEIEEVKWIEPMNLKNDQVRFPQALAKIQKIFLSLNSSH